MRYETDICYACGEPTPTAHLTRWEAMPITLNGGQNATVTDVLLCIGCNHKAINRGVRSYNVTFHYTVTVEAEEAEEAGEKAWAAFVAGFGTEFTATDFVSGNPE